MNICQQRRETYRKILNLRNKPRLNVPEEIALARLEEEFKKLMRCGEENDE